MANEAHPSPYPHNIMFDPTPGEWETDVGATPALIYAPPAEGSEESILIATVEDDDTEQAASNARTLAASASMLRMLRGFQRDMDKMGYGSDSGTEIYGPDAIDLLQTIYDEIDTLFCYYKIQPSKREIVEDAEEAAA